MITRNLIDISNHPDLPKVTRKAIIVQSVRNDKANVIDLTVEIFHYISGVEVKYFPKSVKLDADNNDFVDPKTGDKVVKEPIIDPVTQEQIGEDYPPGSVGEYDYLWYLVNVAKVFTQDQLEELYIVKRVDVIDRKLYS